MTSSFSDLSTEGKLAKLEQHLASGHPVPAQWVSWIVRTFVPTDAWPTTRSNVQTAFADVSDELKLEKIAFHLPDGFIPAPWVSWLCDEFIVPTPVPTPPSRQP